MSAMYFKGGKGILNPVDVDGNEIKEGDILTHCWFDVDFPRFFIKHYPDYTKEKIDEITSKPAVQVKWSDKGFFYAESITDQYSYMHDFRFKYARIVNMNNNG